MALRDRVEASDADRRLLLLLVVLLVMVGSGVGTILFTGPSAPPSGNGTTPTPTASPSPPAATATPGGQPPTDTNAPSPTPTPTDVPSPTPSPTPDDDPEESPTEAGTETRGGGDSDGSPSGPSPTPSPGLELGTDGPLLAMQNAMPGESGSGTLTLRNAEDEAGNLTVSAVGITDEENGITDAESAVDDSPAVGELSSHLEVRLAVRDAAGDETYLLGTDDGYVTLADLPERTPSAEYRLASGESVTLVADWRLPSSTGNVVQSDGVAVDLGLTLESTAE